jgi:hypothetical protein
MAYGLCHIYAISTVYALCGAIPRLIKKSAAEIVQGDGVGLEEAALHAFNGECWMNLIGK